ncbi:MAG TPA: hypothetical protein VH138_07655, partial [Vicinamibacterales bacterium]|nr:hypothetical protein [Vicinamibacterales bacterium]
MARLPKPCKDALTAIARVGLDEYDSGGEPQTVIVPLTPEFAACAAETDPHEVPHQSGPATVVKDPILKKEVKPDYTEAVKRRRTEGRQELDAVISRTGCISSAK